MMRRLRRAAPALAALAACAAAGVGASGALTAPTTPKAFPATGTYKGATAPSEDLVTRGLSCNVVRGDLSCYDSRAEADRATGQRAALGVLSTCSPPLRVWYGGNFTGSNLSFYDYPGWQNLPAAYVNQVSSWQTGCRSGKLSDLNGGGGAQLSLGANQSQGVMPLGWNDKANAIYRG
jgi:hypothetical protein